MTKGLISILHTGILVAGLSLGCNKPVPVDQPNSNSSKQTTERLMEAKIIPEYQIPEIRERILDFRKKHLIPTRPFKHLHISKIPVKYTPLYENGNNKNNIYEFWMFDGPNPFYVEINGTNITGGEGVKSPPSTATEENWAYYKNLDLDKTP